MPTPTFAYLAEEADRNLDTVRYGVSQNRALHGIGYALLAHAKAMEDIANAIDRLASAQSRPSM